MAIQCNSKVPSTNPRSTNLRKPVHEEPMLYYCNFLQRNNVRNLPTCSALRALSWEHREPDVSWFSTFRVGIEINSTKIPDTHSVIYKTILFISIPFFRFVFQKVKEIFRCLLPKLRKSLKVLKKNFLLGSRLNSHPRAARRLLPHYYFPLPRLFGDLIYVRRIASDSLGGAFEKKYGAYNSKLIRRKGGGKEEEDEGEAKLPSFRRQ